METSGDTGAARLGDGPVFVRLDLLERDAELAAIDALLGASGRGRLLAFEGPPGIGKTSLIREARRRARDEGMTVLAARGSELERTFSFGIVRQLFEPFLTQLPNGDRTAVLAGAAELASPLFEPAVLAAAATDDASFAMLHGLYWLTANVAADQPALVAVDDLHWADPSSLRWLAYLLPRLDGLDLSVVVGLRPAEPGQDPAVLDQVISDPLATVSRPAPLSAAAAGQLARERLSPDADEAFCAVLHEITGGNPLFVREVLAASEAEDVGPVAANLPQLRELASRAGWRAVSVRLSRLAPEATRLAGAVAILGDGVDPYQAAALAELDESAASEATAALARVDVLRHQPPLRFVHPLVRRAVYESLTPLERSNGHARASHLLAEGGAEPERIAAHLLLVPPALIPPEADAWVVPVLRDAGSSARRHGAAESAVAYLRRALAEPPDGDRADLLLELGTAEALIDGAAAAQHLRDAHDLIVDPVRKGRTAFLLGRVLYFLSADDSAAVFARALEDLAGLDSELENILEAGLVSHALQEPRLYPEAMRRLERIRADPEEAAVSDKWLLALLACFDARANAPAEGPVALARRVLVDRPLLPGEVALSPSSGPCMVAGNVLVMADLDEAVTLYDAAIADAHRNRSMLDFALAKVFRAQTFVHRGDLGEAEADAREAREACEGWGTSARLAALTSAFLADALMEQGRLDDAAAAIAHAGLLESLPDTALPHFVYSTRARLRMLRGDPAGALDETLEAGRRFEAVGGHNPAWMPWRSQAAHALLALGDRGEAHRLAREEVALARVWGAPRALAAALRAAGLAEGGATGLALLHEAVDVAADSPAKLEHARARTELGAALRRGNRRSQAREHLRRAVELATICGAAPLAAQAEAELLASGARPRRVFMTGLESLTPSERRVAEMAAAGPSNPEIAQALFVSTKTVETHLSRVYRKLRISSRSELPAALADLGSA